MSIFFGTDGIRGKYNSELTGELAFKCGNALGLAKHGLKIIIGCDTRSSSDLLSLAFACGAMSVGCDITNVGVCPTAGLSYLTQKLGFDYGVMVSASHNPAEYNGIKIFDRTGRKISEKEEDSLEKKFFKSLSTSYREVGKYYHKINLINLYVDYLDSLFDMDLSDKSIVLDCSNGASSFIAKRLFRKKGARVYAMASKPNGLNINLNCGSLHIENLKKMVVKKKANYGFAYDGDSDRLVAVSENGEIITGDHLVYAFAKYYQSQGKLNPAKVVGTKHTNMGIELELQKLGINLIRTDIGDKYVSQKLDEENLLVGGEQSGHIILKEFMPTGDGILSSLFLAYVCSRQDIKLSEFAKLELLKQTNINVSVKDKNKIMTNHELLEMINKKNNELSGLGRLMVRPSGTEQVVRIMVETKDDELSKKVASDIFDTINDLEK